MAPHLPLLTHLHEIFAKLVKRQLQYALLLPARSNMQTSFTNTAGTAALCVSCSNVRLFRTAVSVTLGGLTHKIASGSFAS